MDIIDIVKRCKAGNREALGELYLTLLPSMKKVVSRYIPSAEIAEDIIHDGFIIAFGSITTLKNEARIEQWLTTIMRNLSLQYLREAAGSRESIDESLAIEDDNDSRRDTLSWDELDNIISSLPTGYGNVFRLAVLDGLSHKEIGDMLGIAPHSSSSQLTHAKAMLRKLISDYRTKMDMLAMAMIIAMLIICHLINKESIPTTIVADENQADTIEPTLSIPVDNPDTATAIVKPIHRRAIAKEVTAEASIPVEKQIVPSQSDSVANDTLPHFLPRFNPTDDKYIAQATLPQHTSTNNSDWSIAISYTGNRGIANDMRYPNPNAPDSEGPSDDIIEKVNHHMPVTIGLSVNKRMTSRWSLETGLRYTYLRSDSTYESYDLSKLTVQRIHYIGVPLKFSYRLYSLKGFSLYAQG
ncbi:MAG: sigma-70 family RNA polymerase sigma factor, partial [Muribaculaceae bacterium]|nr:sigma-70 family RNA polymerase sigma factor [Muribaculaceae bacterium]